MRVWKTQVDLYKNDCSLYKNDCINNYIFLFFYSLSPRCSPLFLPASFLNTLVQPCTGMSNSTCEKETQKGLPNTHTHPHLLTQTSTATHSHTLEITQCLAFVSFHFLKACLPAFPALHQKHQLNETQPQYSQLTPSKASPTM